MNPVPIFPREVEKTLKLVLDSIGEGVLVADEDGTPVFWNSTAERMLGFQNLRSEHGPGAERPGFFAADGVAHLTGKDRPLIRAMRGEDITDLEVMLRSRQGELILVSCTARALLDDTQRIVGGVAVFREAARDVTQLRAAQEALKASLAEKEVLLKEIHHRVKNNLQVISSLLKLHGEQVADPLAKAAFEDSQDRVRSIALLHEQLYQSKNLGSVGAADYAGSLVQTLMRAHGSLTVARVSIAAPGVFLSVDLAVPCGLILNELVTNSLKHAFVQRVEPSPEIRIAMSTDGQELTLSVSDNGIGLRGDFDLSKSQSLGMQLVRTLARQLRAKVTMTSASGTHWSFRFPRQLSGRQEF